MQTISLGTDETKAIARKFAKKFESGVIALTGELGAGKTTFVQGFAGGLGIKDKIISPTFVLIRQHKIPKTDKTLFHIDLYRIEKFDGLGLEEIIEDPNNIILIEWAEKASDLLPNGTTWINIVQEGENKRKITISD